MMATAVKTKQGEQMQEGSYALPKGKTKAQSPAAAKKGFGGRGFLLAFAGFIFALGLLYVGAQNVVLERGFAVGALKTDIAKLNDEIGHLNLTISELKAPERIETIALESLGMKRATREDMVFYAASGEKIEDAAKENGAAAAETAAETGVLEMMYRFFHRE